MKKALKPYKFNKKSFRSPMSLEGLFIITDFFTLISSVFLLEEKNMMFGDGFFDAHTTGNHIEDDLIEGQGFVVGEDNET